MTDILRAIILGIVEGITEFLPISSTGHLIVVTKLLDFPDTAGAFEIGIQSGAVLAVLWFFRRNLIEQARAVPRDRDVQHFWLAILLAFIPVGIVGFFLDEYITKHLFSVGAVGVSLVAGGVILWLVELLPHRAIPDTPVRVSLGQAFLIGVAQIAALIPGVSRSGSTIVGGMLAGLDRKTATLFSFYLSIPTLGTATAYTLLKDLDTVRNALAVMIVGTAVACVTALLAIRWLLRYVSRNDFRPLAGYRIVVGIAILVALYVR